MNCDFILNSLASSQRKIEQSLFWHNREMPDGGILKATSVTSKNLPYVYKSCPKMISAEN